MAYKSGNPALNKKTFENLAVAETSDTMTLEGTAKKSLLLLVICLTFGALGWRLTAQNHPAASALLMIALVATIVVALITIFKKTVAPFTAPIYAALEGFILGAISMLFEAQFNGIVLQAIIITSGIFASMLVIYLSRIIKVTENLKLGIFAATGGIAIYYLVNLIFSLFGRSMPLIASNSIWGIGFSVLVVFVAALNLVLDFDFIETGVQQKAPKYMEWYAGFGLLVTLVWLYLEILRLLAKARSR